VRFLVTAGPTREPIDPVRYISNRSSGKMGYAIAEAALEAGHDVVLISGPVNLDPPRGAHFISILTSDEMYNAVDRAVRDCDALVMCAAVADYRPQEVSPTKIKKRDQNFSLELVPTRDILGSLQNKDRQFLVVGFAAETNDLEANAQKDSGMESDENEVTVLFRNGETKKIPRARKKIIAHTLVKIFSNR